VGADAGAPAPDATAAMPRNTNTMQCGMARKPLTSGSQRFSSVRASGCSRFQSNHQARVLLAEEDHESAAPLPSYQLHVSPETVPEHDGREAVAGLQWSRRGRYVWAVGARLARLGMPSSSAAVRAGRAAGGPRSTGAAARRGRRGPSRGRRARPCARTARWPRAAVARLGCGAREPARAGRRLARPGRTAKSSRPRRGPAARAGASRSSDRRARRRCRRPRSRWPSTAGRAESRATSRPLLAPWMKASRAASATWPPVGPPMCGATVSARLASSWRAVASCSCVTRLACRRRARGC
jgi:hypothetical protein